LYFRPILAIALNLLAQLGRGAHHLVEPQNPAFGNPQKALRFNFELAGPRQKIG